MDRTAILIDARSVETLDLLGPTLQILTPPSEDAAAPCLLRGTIPAGGSVPLHSHPEPESFLAVSGEVEGLLQSNGGFTWVPIRPGDVFHVPGGAKHAWRNRSGEPAVSVVVTEESLAAFFREVGTPVGTPPAPDAAQRFAEASLRRGHWLGTPEQNAEVGLPS
jgi:mannose-6-phosphate isomerase-like protein (cupin superfamily)